MAHIAFLVLVSQVKAIAFVGAAVGVHATGGVGP